MPRFERRFQIWEYWVSHSQLLLRSPGDLRFPPGSSEFRNVDVIFGGVEYIDLPAIMWDFELVDAIDEDFRRAEQALGKPVSAEHVFVVVTQGRRCMVVAGGMRIFENDLQLMQSTLERA